MRKAVNGTQRIALDTFDNLNYERLRDELVRAQALQFRNGELRFRYKATFYYFVAAYFADNLTKEKVRDEVKDLCNKLHRESVSNIVLFLCHKSKDPIILNAVLGTADGLFRDRDEVDLIEDTAFAGKLQLEVQTPVLDDGDPEKRRLQALEIQDEMQTAPSDDEEGYAHRFESDRNDQEAEEDDETSRIVADFNSAIKTIQITGQILRNFGGRLDGDEKIRLTDACFSLGLRLTRFVYAMFHEHESALVNAVTNAILEKNPSIKADIAREAANAFLFALLKMSTIGLIRHVSNSVGLEKLGPVFSEVLKTKPTVARRMVDLSIRLDHFGAFPVEQTLSLNLELQGSLIASDVLRQLVFNRFYFFSAPHDVKQQICKKLDIKIQPILLDTDQKRDK